MCKTSLPKFESIILLFSITLGCLITFCSDGRAEASVEAANLQSYKSLVTPKIFHPSRIKRDEYKSFDIVLKPQHGNQIMHQAIAVNDPGNPYFKHYMTVKKIGEYYGQSPALLGAWKSYLNQHRLKCSWFKNRIVLKVSGQVKYISKIFNVNLRNAVYHTKPLRLGAKGASIPKKLAQTVLTITGITDYNYHTIFSDSFNNSDFKGNSTRVDSDTKKIMGAYNGNYLYRRGLTGKGTEIGIIAFGSAKKKNILHFWRHEGASINQKRLKIKPVFSNRFEKTPVGTDDLETTQDAEIAGAIAKQARIKIFVVPEPYPNLMNVLNAYLTAFDDTTISVTTCSWGLGSQLTYLSRHHLVTPHYRYLLNLVLAQGALQGVSNFTASGDFGVHGSLRSLSKHYALMDYQNAGQDPLATNPFITSVGATIRSFHMKVNKQTFGYHGPETSWGFATNIWPKLSKKQHTVSVAREMINGSGGGFAHFYRTPNYQQGVLGVNTFCARQYFSYSLLPVNGVPPLLHGKDDGRNYPDISANMIGYKVYQRNGKDSWVTSGGTSITSPQFAGIAALINGAKGHLKMGFWNPQIYQLAKNNDSVFRSLNKTTNNCNDYYTGQPGKVYNQATGLGIPNFKKLFLTYK